MTASRTSYEQLVLNEIRNYPEASLPKLLKMLNFLRIEIFDSNDRDKENQQLFWKSFGSWKDERSAEDIIKEIYASRESSERDILL